MTSERVPSGLPTGVPATSQGAISALQTSNAPAAVEVRIDELVLHGFDPRHRHVIGDAVEGELIRLFAGGAGEMNWGAEVEVSRLDAGSFPAAPDATAASVGAVLAETIFRALMRWIAERGL